MLCYNRMWRDLPTFSQRLFVDTEQELEAWRSSIGERYGAFKEEEKIALPATERTKAKRDATTAKTLRPLQLINENRILLRCFYRTSGLNQQFKPT